MKIGLGIDTGGTYTDGVLYDFDSKEILSSAKAITTKEDLTVGISNVLDSFPKDMLSKVKLVSLSTTLATNACVEGKGCRTVMVMIGCDPDTVRKYGHEYGLPDYREMIFIDGGHDLRGEIVTEPDWNRLKEGLLAQDSRADAYGVVELWGIRNPEFERKAAAFIKELTGKNVVCAHELTMELNFMRRTASTLLNAQLIPIIDDFLAAVKASLKRRNITAPMVIVRGDGSLMTEDFAKEKPIETLLSGPAASVAGGTKLSGRKNCIIVDMGGTTSDLAMVENYRVKLADEGAVVGSWRTGTKSIDIRTIGLGGDSYISFDKKGNIRIGPERVAPLSWLAAQFPGVLKDIEAIYENKKIHTRPLCQFFYLIKDTYDESGFSYEEKKIAGALKKGPLSIMALCDEVGTSIYELKTERLEKLGVILRSALTPTDIMHLTGEFTGWNRRAAQMGAAVMAFQLKMSVDRLIQMVNENIKRSLYLNIVKMLLEREGMYAPGDVMPEKALDLIMMGCDSILSHKGKALHGHGGSGLKCSFSTDFALVGIGAPIHVFLPDVARALNTEYIIPDNAAVANAAGAITGEVAAVESVTVRPKDSGYFCYSSLHRKEFASYEEALSWARKEAEEIAIKRAQERGGVDIYVTTEVLEDTVDLPILNAIDELAEQEEDKNSIFLIETVVTARAVGSIKGL